MHLLLNGAQIYCEEFGTPTALPVIFLHGFPFSHEMWQPQLAEVSKRYRAIAYDIRGHGKSDVGDGQYTIEGHVDDLIALLDHLHIEKVVIVGLSMGGYTTLRALERNPERFIAAVLCDTKSEPDSDEAKLNRFAGMVTAKRDGSRQFADNFVKNVFAPETLQSAPEKLRMIHQIISHTPPLSIAGTLLALASRTDTTPSLGRIAIPVLILVGEHDATTPPAAARMMQERIKGAELHIVPHAAHMSNIENAPFFNGKLLPFLERVAAGYQSR